MKKITFILFILTFTLTLSAQEEEHKGTIKVEKKGQLQKIIFDNVNYRLIGIDQYGNILDSAVVEFQMSVTINGIFYSEKAAGPTLTYQMQELIRKCDTSPILFFENIKARNKKGTLVNMPKFKYTFGFVNENSD
ncbi:MAG: hypothetical protein ACT4ON_09230 [Bacteroidota bacterium]